MPERILYRSVLEKRFAEEMRKVPTNGQGGIGPEQLPEFFKAYFRLFDIAEEYYRERESEKKKSK